MDRKEGKSVNAVNTVEDAVLARALNELGRSINLVTTYGTHHPAAQNALAATTEAMQALFSRRKKISIGSFNGLLTVDDRSVQASGTLQKSLERRLVRLKITELKIARNTSTEEFGKLAELLATSDVNAFERNFCESGIENIQSENTRYEAVRKGQTVANENDLAGRMGADGVLVLDDGPESGLEQDPEPGLHVDHIVAFLKGDIESPSDEAGKELTKMASDPDQLGRMIMESVAIRQSAPDLSGESLNDIILGCLRRTYSGLRKQSDFQKKEGKVELKKSLLLLEESLLEKMRSLGGADDPEMDRQIVQAVREMDETLGFEIAAAEYMEHREASEQMKKQLHSFIQAQGAEAAEELLHGSGFPGSDWRRIVVESRRTAIRENSDVSEDLSRLTTVFEKLEELIKSEKPDSTQVKELLGQAKENLGDTLGYTKDKLEALSSTIGGQAHTMSRDELLATLAEVAQELMQPLTAIIASLEMMLDGYAGGVTDEQQDLLTLASNSGEHLRYLMDMLIEIVGCPANKGIDDRFHTTSEQIQLRKGA